MKSNEVQIVLRDGNFVLINNEGKYLQAGYTKNKHTFSKSLKYAVTGSQIWLQTAADLIGFKIVKRKAPV